MARWRKGLLILLLWGMAFVIPELLARLLIPEWSPVEENTSTMMPDRDVGWIYKPLEQADTARMSGTFVASSLGLRSAELEANALPRVVFLGDSFTWGWGVPDGERYTDKIKQAYPQYQVINAGINGYSTVQASLLLEKYWQSFSPNLVVLQVFHNDFEENLEVEAAYAKPYLDWNQQFALMNHPVVDSTGWWMRALLWVGDHTYFYRQVLLRAYLFLVSLGVNWSEEKIEPPQDPAILEQGMAIALNRLILFCQQHRVPLMMISSDLESYQHATVQRVADQQGVPYYDLSQRVFVGQKDFDLRDHAGHWNAYGHELVADFAGPLVHQQLQQQQNKTSGTR